MRKLLYIFAIMLCVIVVLPLLIVKSCSIQEQDELKYKQGLVVKVRITEEERMEDMLFEEYLKGVVAAEMPAEFEFEALKAQAVAARTYSYGRMLGLYVTKDDVHQGADICTDFRHCQAWTGTGELRKKWGLFNSMKYWNRISKAVEDTEGMILTYDGKVINPLFHSNSGGRTENNEEYFRGKPEPYLRSVVSEGEEACSGYEVTVTMPVKEFIDKLKQKFPKLKLDEKHILEDIDVVDYSEGGKIKDIRVGSIKMEGRNVREALSLRSTNFSLELADSETLAVTTIGYGHGVGMSQWGANAMAKKGKNFEEILKHYYTDVEMVKMEEEEKTEETE
jgi:stage II sporulation protein D